MCIFQSFVQPAARYVFPLTRGRNTSFARLGARRCQAFEIAVGAADMDQRK
jgi:hypothetical protein